MKLVKLEQVAKFINGRAFKPSEWETEGLPIIRIQNLTGSTSTVNYYSKEVDERYYVKDGDILISWSASLGVYKWQGGDAILNQHIFKVVPNEKMINREYFYYAAQNVLEEMKKHIHGATMQHITRDPFLALEIPLPPLPEQKWIAAQLAQADRLRQLRRNASQLGESYLQSAFLAMFGDPARNPKKLKKVKIRDVASIIVPTRDKPKSFSGTIPWITLPDLNGMFISSSKNLLTTEEADEVGNRLMPENTVLLSCAGSLGKIAIATREVYANQQFYGLVANSKKLNHVFFAKHLIALGEDFYFKIAGISTLGFFSKNKALDIEIMLPPLSEQERFAQIVARYEKLRAQMSESTRQAELLFQGLLHESFGEQESASHHV